MFRFIHLSQTALVRTALTMHRRWLRSVRGIMWISTKASCSFDSDSFKAQLQLLELQEAAKAESVSVQWSFVLWM